MAIPHVEYAIGANEQAMIKQVLADGRAISKQQAARW